MRYLSLFLLLPFCGFSQSLLFTSASNVKVSRGDAYLTAPWSGGFNAAQLNMVDLDGDNQEEIILLDRYSEVIDIFSFEGGKYVFRPELVGYLPATNPDWMVLSDYNCDGRKDLFVYSPNGVVLYENTTQPGSYASWEKVADPLLTTGYSGKINLYVNPADVPAITDIDGDGDVDILCYNFATGEDIRFHKNLSMEKYGNCDALDFEIADRQWGQFKECSCFQYAFFGKSCQDVSNGRVAHVSGKSLTARDNDGDGDKDLFLGHDDCDHLIYLENVGKKDSAVFTSFLSEYPSQKPAIIYLYPTANFLDVDYDGKDELTVSPNIDKNLFFASDFAHSLWVYEQEGTDTSPNYKFLKSNFLQDEMLDFGELSAPVFFDVDGDGDYDILVAANGIKIDGVFYGRIALLKNIGTSFNPVFSVESNDFMNLSTLKLQVPKLRFADFNKDGKIDLFYSGYSEGVIKSYIYLNTATTGAAKFDVADPLSTLMPLNIYENPEFFDEDGDGDPDLLVGKRDGSLDLYENTGNNVFEIKETEFHGIIRDFSLEKTNLFVTVTDVDGDGKEDLLLADRKEVSVVYNFENSDAEPVVLNYFNITTQAESPIGTASYNWISVADIFGSGYNTMMLGGSGGGLQLFRNIKEVENPETVHAKVKIYPNPISSGLPLVLETNRTGLTKLFNVWGQQLSTAVEVEAGIKNYIALPVLSSGVYILKYENNLKESLTQKLVVH